MAGRSRDDDTSTLDGHIELMKASGERNGPCVICGERKVVNPFGDNPTCGTCRSAVCRLRQLDESELRTKTRRAVTRLKRIVAARFGVAHRVVKTQYEETQTDLQS